MSETKYFTGLNYTLGNEDTTVEIKLAEVYKPKSVFAVCGSGGRSLPLAMESVESLTLSDLSEEQLMLAELRLSTYKEFSYDDFLKFWGYFPYSDDNYCDSRKSLFEKLSLTKKTRDYFQDIYSAVEFQSILYSGKWERTFQILAKITRVLMGKDFDRILRFDNLKAQQDYYKNEFPINRWKAVLFLVGNKTLFNALLYKGSFIEKNIQDSHFDFYFKAYERLFTRSLAQNSFFVQLCFYGKIMSINGVPVEAGRKSFERVKGYKGSVQYLKTDLIEHLKKGDVKHDFLSLSDVPSYFKGELEKNFMQMIRPGLNEGAIVINRYYLRVPDCDLRGYTDITDKHRNLVDSELVQMYDIRIYQYTPSKV
jgi:S-adenosylmethionine-diacylglycerol 3-amino-3-carboxypropyl transferase